MAKKKSKRKAVSSRKTAKKKSTPRASAGRKSKPKTARTPSAGDNSVDQLLTMFRKDRTQKEAALATTKKKKLELEEKVRSMREQVTELGQREREQQAELSALDQKRDNEVQQLLQKLGINLGGGNPARERQGNNGNEKPNHVANDRLKQTLEIPPPDNANGRND